MTLSLLAYAIRLDGVAIPSRCEHVDLFLLVDGDLFRVQVNDETVHDRRSAAHDERERERRGHGGDVEELVAVGGGVDHDGELYGEEGADRRVKHKRCRRLVIVRGLSVKQGSEAHLLEALHCIGHDARRDGDAALGLDHNAFRHLDIGTVHGLGLAGV